ncbi:MAG: winged helix-turn-helix domain-containing protein, partial [Chloroflexi bacterium]|nr:winged helix-turn-helix domain-containing protein [Chloroflexota bacterium]
MVEYGILGPLTCHDDGQAVELGGSRTRAVLAILLLERDRVVSADRLIELVWGEDPPPTAETALQGHVSRLRRILGRWAIETRPPGYLLRAEPGAVDAERFASLVDRARAASPSDAGGMLREALALW